MDEGRRKNIYRAAHTIVTLPSKEVNKTLLSERWGREGDQKE